MTLTELLDALKAAGLSLSVRECKVIVSGNLKLLTQEMRNAIAEQKAAIVEHLKCRVCIECWDHPEQLYVQLCPTCPESIRDPAAA